MNIQDICEQGIECIHLIIKIVKYGYHVEGYKCQILAESLNIIANVTPDSNIGGLESRGLQRQS